MHELSLAMNVVSIANDAVKRASASKATAITLEIGECAGVELDAFDFAWPLAVKGSVLEGAVKEIIEIGGKAKCQNCGSQFSIHRLYDRCPNCGSYLCDIYQGKEFKVKSIRVI